jgi:AcrR family transcriptional regulator
MPRGNRKKEIMLAGGAQGTIAATTDLSTVKIPARGRVETAGEETRKRILDAAQHLFAKHGFSATTTKAIAEKAEVPGGLIFYYFPSKKALLEAVVSERNILEELSAAAETVISPEPRAMLIALGQRYLAILKQHEELARILLREFRSYPEIARQFHTLRQEHIELIGSCLHRSLQLGHHAPQRNIHAIARTFLYNIIVIAVIEDAEEPHRLLEEMVDVLI